MAVIQNSYAVGKPVQGEAFCGRDEIIAEIERRLPYERLLILYGPRRIGKTSILQNLSRAKGLSRFTFIYVDSSQMVTQSVAEARYYLATEIAKTLNLKVPPQSNFTDRNVLHRHFLPWACQRMYPQLPVLILDEFDVLDRPSQEAAGHAEMPFEFMQELIETESQLAIIIGLGPKLGEQSRSLQHYLHLERWIRVSRLDPEATRAVIVNPAADEVTYTSEAVEYVITLTSGHPYFTQLVCSEVFDSVHEMGKKHVSREDVAAAAARILESDKADFDWLWDDLSPTERVTLALLAEASDGSGLITSQRLDQLDADHHVEGSGLELESAVNRLVELDLVKREEPTSFRFVVELIRWWVARQHPALAEIEKNAAWLDDRATVEFQSGQEALDLDVAIKHYRAALKTDPDHLEAHLALGAALLEQGHAREAIKVYESARRLDEVRAREGLAQARLAQAQERQGRGRSRKAIMIASGIGVVVVACLAAGLVIPIKGQPLLASLTSPATPAQEMVSLPSATPILTPEASESISVADTATPTMIPVPPTHTPAPVLTSTATESPPTVPDSPTPATTSPPPADTATPTLTPEAPTDTPTTTSTFTPIPSPTPTPLPATPAPTATPIPAVISTPLTGVTPASSIPTGEFTLLYPLTRDDISYGPTDFEWEWTGTLAPGLGFEVRVWREGEFPSGVHDAVLDNQNGNIKNIGGSKYHFSTDIREAPSVQGRTGEYLWTVALVQISPEYKDLGQQAEPARLRFEAGGGGGDGGGDSGGGGGGGVGID
jgi:tetratricopeptide (TPR) repeat protein